MASQLTVVISQAQGKHPAKRRLEEELGARLLLEPGVDVSLVPHVYDMPADHSGLLHLRSISGPLIVLGWLYPRALRWVLDRQGVRGQEGTSLLVPEEDEDDPEDTAEDSADEAASQTLPVLGSNGTPDRHIYCIDLRTTEQVEEYLAEIRRIRDESSKSLVSLLGWVGGNPTPAQMDRYLHPLPIVPEIAPESVATTPAATEPVAGSLQDFTTQEAGRRWYPVIDYTRCTNCMECIDFCLFGVYGVDTLDRILVEVQDNCKKGCPACSRVCPENAILFPQHKTPAIAGAEGDVAGLKIDLSQLFGGPGKDALELAVAERDVELLRDGRDAVGMAVGVPPRRRGSATQPRDELDDLMDELDALEA